MRFSGQQLEKIFLRTSGYCHICHKKLNFKHYGKLGRRGAWEIEHSNPQAKGGTHRLNNLYSACIACNRGKGTKSSRVARARHGKRRAPLSASKRRQARLVNALKGAVLGVVTGIFITFDVAAALAMIGTVAGYWRNPDKDK